MHSESWPESWKLSHLYDELEIWGSRKDPGYRYQYQIQQNWSLHTIQELLPAGGSILSSDWTSRFDVVLAGEVIEHVTHPYRFLICLANVVKPGGRVLVTTPNGKYFRHNNPRFSDCPDPSAFESVQFKPNSDGHIFLLDCDECRMLATNAGLEVERIALMTNPLTHGHVKLGHLLPYLPASLVGLWKRAQRSFPRRCSKRSIARWSPAFASRQSEVEYGSPASH
jgi:SAM-dependent methyltransferase